ncbi:MAG: DM13 domain-containing protein [Anaerolineae bacterium]|nr:DM13 domain-containing protein [Anaerolineae bacterium]
MRRSRLIVFGLVGVIVLVVLTFPLWSPYFRTELVDEAFPVAAANPVDAQTEEATEGGADTTPEVESAPTDTPAEPAVIAQGSFITIDTVHNGDGTATIYEVDGQRVLRLEDFRVTNGPDLYVVLSKTTPTTIFAGVGEDMINLGRLKGNVGNQNYDIPADVDLSQYASVVIYCVQFSVVFTSAALTA